MAISVTHPFVSTITDSSSSAIVKPVNWNAAHVLTMAGPALIGRSTAGTGAAEEITLGTNLTFSGGSLGVTSGVSFNPQYQLFTSNGTWTKPSPCTIVYVRIVGGGAGGSSGGNEASGSNSLGGYGGDCVQILIPASSLGSTVSVTIGTGGTGGSAVSFGNKGSSGGTTFFGTHCAAGGFCGPSTDQTYMLTKLYYGSNMCIPDGGFTGIFTNCDYPIVSYGNAMPMSTYWGTDFSYNGAYFPGKGGTGIYTDGGGFGHSATRGGVGFANTVLVPTVVGQAGDTASAGTATGTSATLRGYGGGGGATSGSSGIPGGNGGNGYLGGGGGGGGQGNSAGYYNPGAGGTGGSGFVEVFAW